MKKEVNVIGQDHLVKEISKILQIFKASECKVRPHFILTGPSGSGKSYTIRDLTEKYELGFLEVNAAQLTKEGTSGNSLSKVLSPLIQLGNKPLVVFVDEWDKLFISGNSNDSIAHETTTGVQNEFLKVLEGETASVFGDYGKYITVGSSNILFVFAGAFNGEENISIDRLREMGVKTEFLGRVGLVYNTDRLNLDDLCTILEKSELLKHYLVLFPSVKREDVIDNIRDYLTRNYDNNALGARLVNTLIHRWFIKGGKLEEEEVKAVSFQKTLELSEA